MGGRASSITCVGGNPNTMQLVFVVSPFSVQEEDGSTLSQEELEDTKGVIRIRKSKNRQHNGQKKKDKRTNNDYKNIHIK